MSHARIAGAKNASQAYIVSQFRIGTKGRAPGGDSLDTYVGDVLSEELATNNSSDSSKSDKDNMELGDGER